MPTSSVNVLLATNAQQFKTEMAIAGAAVYAFGRQAFQVADKVTATGKAIGGAMVGAGVTMAGAMAIAVNAAADLEQALANVATVWDESGQAAAGTLLGLNEAGERILDLSTQLPQSSRELAEGLYDVASSGFQGTEAMQVLEQSAKAASAGLTNTATSGRAITAVLNAYGKSASEVESVSDILFQTVNLGALSFEELAQNLGDFVPGAAALGVPLEDAGSALATITLNGFNASQAATALTGVFRKLAAPTADMAALLAENGYASGQMALAAVGLDGVMQLVAKSIDGDATALRGLFEEQEAVNGAMSLLAQNGALYNRVLEDMGTEAERAGATQEALDKQAQSLNFQLDILKNTIGAIVADFGQALLPIVKPVVSAMQDFASAIADIPDEIKTLLAGGALLLTGLTLLAGAWVIQKIQISLVEFAVRKLGIQAAVATRALGLLRAAAGPMAIVLTAGVTALTLWGSQTRDAKEQANEFKSAVDNLKGSLDAETGAITAQTRELIIRDLVEKDLDESARKMGISIQTLTDAYLDDKDAIKEVSDAVKEYRANLDPANMPEQADLIIMPGETAKDLEKNLSDVEKAYLKDWEAAEKLYDEVVRGAKAVRQATGEKKREVKAQAELNGAMSQGVHLLELSEDAYKAVNQAMASQFGLAAVMQQALEAQADGQKELTDTLRDELADRHELEQEALDDRHEMQQEAFAASRELLVEALEDQQEIEREALADRHEAEREALDDFNEATKEAIEDRAEVRRAGYEREAQDLRDALDEQQRIEQDAFDVRMENLRDTFDERIEEENEAWERRKEEILNNIEDTFGAERQGWQQILEDEEDAHEDRVDALEEEGDAAVRAETNVFDDMQEAQDRALDERLRTMRDDLDAIKQAEVDAWDDQLERLTTHLEDTQEAESEALTTRHEGQKEALDAQTEQLQDALNDRFERERTHLDDRQELENDAADARYNAAGAKQKLSLEQLQGYLDEAKAKQEQFNRDLAIIASRGGADVLGEIAKLGPDIVAQAAAAGPEALTALLESIRQSLIGFQAPADYSRYFVNPLATMAEGHYAQVALSGPRLWAEPETGGEAYIPLALSKRARSTSILAQTAHAFGYGLVSFADGGYLGGAGSAGGGMSVNMPIHVEARVEAGIDMGRAGAIIARQVENGVRTALGEVERQVRVKAWRN